MLTSQCGFKLRAKNHLPAQMRHLYLQTDRPYDKLVLFLKQSLISLGAQLSPSPETADVVLRILDINFSHSSPDVRTSDKARTYTLIYQALFEMRDRKGNIVLPAQSVLVTRTLVINQGQTLYSNNELSVVKQEMQRELVSLLLYRLEAKTVRDAINMGSIPVE